MIFGFTHCLTFFVQEPYRRAFPLTMRGYDYLLLLPSLLVAVHSTKEDDSYDSRCPWDPSEPVAWQRGDVDRFFTRLSSGKDPDMVSNKYKITVLSSPFNSNNSATKDGQRES